MNRHKIGYVLLCIILLYGGVSAQTIKIRDYYPIADGNEWRYTAPPGWKDGDYVSQMKIGELMALVDGSYGNDHTRLDKPIKHYDATKAAKVLMQVKGRGIYYIREEFANDGGVAVFDNPILWFIDKFQIGMRTDIERGFTRTYPDGRTTRGTYKLIQSATRLENVTVPAGTFNKALRVESESFWNLGDGRTAKTVSVYHYAKKVGVVKASARFIIIKDGKEIINRLVETDLKSYKLTK